MTRTVIVTGGAGGIGLATARIMGADHRVVLTDLDADRLRSAVDALRRDDVDAVGIACDITDRRSVDALFDDAGGTGTVRAVVHAAGVSPRMGAAEFVVRVDALGTVNVAEASLAIAEDGFALVNVASIAGHLLPATLTPTRTFRLALSAPDVFATKLTALANRGPAAVRSATAYSLSKSFVLWYTREIAGRFGDLGARVVSVSPGGVDTAMGRLEESAGSGTLVEYSALKRFGRPEEVAEVLAFCASDRPGYLTGVDILCDGGSRAGLDLRGLVTMVRRA